MTIHDTAAEVTKAIQDSPEFARAVEELTRRDEGPAAKSSKEALRAKREGDAAFVEDSHEAAVRHYSEALRLAPDKSYDLCRSRGGVRDHGGDTDALRTRAEDTSQTVTAVETAAAVRAVGCPGRVGSTRMSHPNGSGCRIPGALAPPRPANALIAALYSNRAAALLKLAAGITADAVAFYVPTAARVPTDAGGDRGATTTSTGTSSTVEPAYARATRIPRRDWRRRRQLLRMAERDCSLAITAEPGLAKAYVRRGTARHALALPLTSDAEATAAIHDPGGGFKRRDASTHAEGGRGYGGGGTTSGGGGGDASVERLAHLANLAGAASDFRRALEILPPSLSRDAAARRLHAVEEDMDDCEKSTHVTPRSVGGAGNGGGRVRDGYSGGGSGRGSGDGDVPLSAAFTPWHESTHLPGLTHGVSIGPILGTGAVAHDSSLRTHDPETLIP
jgi:tetratricopeptide (TPR) repeat protein